jgi:hypothetical protein
VYRSSRFSPARVSAPSTRATTTAAAAARDDRDARNGRAR